MSRINLEDSRFKLAAFAMAFLTPIAGALLLMVAVISTILSLQEEVPLNYIRSTVVPVSIGFLLIVTGLVLLVGLLQDKPGWIFLYVALSTPGLVYLLVEATTIDFLLEFKLSMILALGLMVCGQICVGVYFILKLKKKRTESIDVILYDRFGSYLRDNSSESCSL